MKFAPDPSRTFETFVVGPGNRMAAAAARRAAESPGTSYNPLYLYGAAGVGKSHLLWAVGDLALTVRPDLVVVCETAEEAVDRLSAAVAAGAVDQWRDGWLDAGLILLDDVQALAGRTRTQEEMLRLWDTLAGGGAQLVLAADRPPVEIADLSEELRARLGGGLTVDVAPPEPETREALVEARARAAHVELAPGAARAVASLPLEGVPALFGAVDRVGERQREAGRRLAPDEVEALLDPGAQPDAGLDEFSAFLSDIASTVEELVETAPWRRTLAEAILRWEGEGIRTRRLEEALEADSAPDVDSLLAGFAADVERLRAAGEALLALDEKAADAPALRDPDRVAEAEALLAEARRAAERPAGAAAAPERAPAPAVDRWFLSREKLAWGWMGLDDRVIEEGG